MNLSEDVNVNEFVNAKDELSGADIKALCTEVNYIKIGWIISSKRKKNENNISRFKICKRKSLIFKKEKYSRRTLFVKISI